MSDTPRMERAANESIAAVYEQGCQLERELAEVTKQRDEAKAEMWKARNALITLAGATRHLLTDFCGFKYVAREAHDFGKSHSNYSIERAKGALEKARTLVTTWRKGGDK